MARRPTKELSLSPPNSVCSTVARMEMKAMHQRRKKGGAHAKRPLDAYDAEAALVKRKSSDVTETDSDARRLRISVGVCIFCNAVTRTMPVVLIPLIAAEQANAAGAAAFVASVASISTIGGAAGKFVNGFVCQHLGGQRSGSIYMLCSAMTAILLSRAKSHVGILLFSFEFFASIQWTSNSSVLSNHFDDNPKAFAAGITAMSLGSVIGTLTAKAIGMVILQTLHWRQVAQLAAVVAVMGSMVMRFVVHEYPKTTIPPPRLPFSIQRVVKSAKAVLGSFLFWTLGMVHATSCVASTSDRVLGGFFRDETMLPRSVCGGLTASVTLGFIHGLAVSRDFPDKNLQGKKFMLERRYWTAVISALLLAVCARAGGFHPMFVATAIAMASGGMASSLSFQFYQIPNMVASVYGENQAVCLSLIDGVGYIIVAPVWALVGKIVAIDVLGWAAAWIFLAALIGMGGVVTVLNLPIIWERQELLLARKKSPRISVPSTKSSTSSNVP